MENSEQKPKYRYEIEYAWRRYITVYAEDKDKALEYAKEKIPEFDRTFTGKICFTPITEEADKLKEVKFDQVHNFIPYLSARTTNKQ